MRDVTIIFPINEDYIFLGNKKRGFGKGKINGFGGKYTPQDKTIEEAALRELFEEIGIKSKLEHLQKVGVIEFSFPPEKAKEWNQRAHVYFLNQWEGEPSESEEMTVEKYKINEIPYEKMWDTDQHWMPKLIEGKKIKAKFEFEADFNTTKSFDITEVDEL